MTIKFIKPANAVGFGYQENEVAELPAEAAQKLIDTGFAVLFERKQENPETRESKAAPEMRGRRKK